MGHMVLWGSKNEWEAKRDLGASGLASVISAESFLHQFEFFRGQVLVHIIITTTIIITVRLREREER